MTSTVALSYRVYDLPWSADADQDGKFRRHLRTFIVASLLLSLVLSFLPVPERDPADVAEISERYARLLLEQKAPPPPPPVVREEPEPVPVEPEPVVEEVVVPEPEPVVQETVVEPAVEPMVEPVVVTEQPVVDVVATARERASVAGLLPFTQELASLRDAELADTLVTRDMPGEVTAAAPANERSLITSSVGTSSGGINTAALSRNTGGSGIGTRATTVVESPVEQLAPAGGAAVRTGDSDLPSRSREEIERVFDTNKGAIYALYNRALRTNPALQGKVVLRITITPDGRVSLCEIVSSELGDPDLEQKLVQRIMLFQFEARDVETVTTTKPIDFFPA
jgi:TonB family protein